MKIIGNLSTIYLEKVSWTKGILPLIKTIKEFKSFVAKKLGIRRIFIPNKSQKNNYNQNSKFWRQFFKESNYDGKNGIILSEFQSNFFMQCGIAILTNFVAKKYNSSVLFLSQRSRVSPLLKFYLTSFNKRILFSTIDDITSDMLHEIDASTKELFESLYSPQDILKLTYNNYLIGEFVYDSVLTTTEAAYVDKVDINVYKEIKKCISALVTCDIIDSKYTLKGCVLSHKVGSFYGPLISFSNLRKIETFLGIGGVGTIGRKSNFDGLNDLAISQFRPPEKLLDICLKNKSIIERSEEYLIRRISGNVAGNIDTDRAFNSSGNYFSKASDFCTYYNLGDKPLVFVMLHAFNDFPHYEDILFDDYYHWLIETLKTASGVDNVNWIIKEHPSAMFWPDNLDLKKLITDYNKNENFVLLNHDENFNAACIKEIATATITCIGTAGLEFSCFGIPAILSGKNHYSNYGITINNESLADYKSSLLNILSTEKLVERDKLKAKILFFLIEGVIRNVELHEILPKFGHDDRLSSGSEVMDYVVNSYDSKSVKAYIERLDKYVMSNDNDGFINDDELFKLLNNSPKISKTGSKQTGNY